MEQAERERLLMVLSILSQMPELGYNFKGCPPGICGIAEWSSYLTDLWFKIDKTGTDEQRRRVEKLVQAYKVIVQDLNESYMLSLLYSNMKKKWRDQMIENEAMKREIIGYKKEIEKLTKTINFE